MEIKLSDQEKMEFADAFLQRYLELGMGAMTKRETEILVFNLLYFHTDLFLNQDNYNVANFFKITERKVKNYITDASLKYESPNHQAALAKIANMMFYYHSIRPQFIDEQNEYLEISLENPVLQREFEHTVKNLGYHVDYSFNRELLRIKSTAFLQVFTNEFPGVAQQFLDTVKSNIDDEKLQEELLDKTRPIGQRIETFLEKNQYKIKLILDILSPLKIPGV